MSHHDFWDWQSYVVAYVSLAVTIYGLRAASKLKSRVTRTTWQIGPFKWTKVRRETYRS